MKRSASSSAVSSTSLSGTGTLPPTRGSRGSRASRAASSDAAAVVRMRHKREVDALRAELRAAHQAEVGGLQKQIAHMATQLVTQEMVVEEAKRMLAKAGKNVDNLMLTDVDFTTLENVPTLKEKIAGLEGKMAGLTRKNKELQSAKERLSAQATTWKGKMTQQLHTHALQCRKYDEEIKQLRKQVAMLENQILSGGSDDPNLKAELTAKLRADMTRLALNESKRHAEREKYLQQFYDEKLAADLAAAKEQFSLKLHSNDETWQQKFSACQENHADEMTAQEEIWQKKIRVLQKSIASLENSQLTRDMVATQTQLLEAATKLFPSPGGKLPPV